MDVTHGKSSTFPWNLVKPEMFYAEMTNTYTYTDITCLSMQTKTSAVLKIRGTPAHIISSIRYLVLLQLTFSSHILYEADSLFTLVVDFRLCRILVLLYPHILPINFNPKITNVFDTNTSRHMSSYKQNTWRQVKQNDDYQRIHDWFWNGIMYLCHRGLHLWFKHWTVYVHIICISLPCPSITYETA
jgi:hypothetical protein